MNLPKQPGVKGYWQPGHQLYQGKYTIEEDLGCGGFGVTYLARDRKSQQVVVKTLNQDVQHHPQFEKWRQDFLNEAIRLAKCSHHPHSGIFPWLWILRKRFPSLQKFISRRKRSP